MIPVPKPNINGSSLVCSAVVSYDITHFRVRAAIGIRLDSTVLSSRAK